MKTIIAAIFLFLICFSKAEDFNALEAFPKLKDNKSQIVGESVPLFSYYDIKNKRLSLFFTKWNWGIYTIYFFYPPTQEWVVYSDNIYGEGKNGKSWVTALSISPQTNIRWKRYKATFFKVVLKARQF